MPVSIVHLVASFNDNYNVKYVFISVLFSKNPSIEIHEITPVCAFNFVIAWEELSCWHFYNSQLLLRVDNRDKNIACDEEDKLQLGQRVKTFYASNKDLAKHLVDAMHKTAG